MITSIKNKKEKRIEIDLNGSEGNVFSLISLATDLARKTGKDVKAIQADMMSDDYDHAVEVLEKHFGDFIILYR